MGSDGRQWEVCGERAGGRAQEAGSGLWIVCLASPRRGVRLGQVGWRALPPALTPASQQSLQSSCESLEGRASSDWQVL